MLGAVDKAIREVGVGADLTSREMEIRSALRDLHSAVTMLADEVDALACERRGG